jgi:hypothetical protein
VPPQDDPPKLADFKNWADIFAKTLATGKQRAYLKAVADKTWDLVVWLQHYTDATQWNAEIALNATRHFLTSFALAYRRFSEGSPTRCPQCDSYRLRVDEDTAEQGGQLGWLSRPVCAGCGWQGPEEFEPFPKDYLQRLDAYIQAVRAEESEDEAS